jgi:hypothetical protein
MKVVRINTDDSMNEVTIKKGKQLVKLLKAEAKSSGSSEFQKLYTWKVKGNTIECYGWYEGEAGFENKHDLIPNGISEFLEEDSSEKLLFGSLFLVKKNMKGVYCDFCVTDYADVYNELFDGFDDCDESEEESEEEEPNEDDEGFIVQGSDDDEESDGSYECEDESEDSYEYKDDEELDTDENEY